MVHYVYSELTPHLIRNARYLNYDNDMYFSPTYGMSLSAAIYLLKDTHYLLYLNGKTDAIFIHKKLKRFFEQSFNIKLPIDEFQCWRGSHLFHQLNQLYVRSWAFQEETWDALGNIWRNMSHFSPVPKGEGEVPFMVKL